MIFLPIVFLAAAVIVLIATEKFVDHWATRFWIDVLVCIATFAYFLWKIHWTISFLW